MSSITDGPAPLVDTHAHLGDRYLAAHLDDVLDRARSAGVVQIVSIGTTAEDSARIVADAGDRPGLYAVVGVHPNDAAAAKPDDWEQIIRLLGKQGVVGLGETGLDRYRDRTPFAVQQEWFDRHLALAFERDLPVVIHCRESAQDIIAQLSALRRPVRGVLHSFTGTPAEAEAFLELGLYLSFAGMVTFTNKALDALRDVAGRVPLDRILVETDSPYLSPHPHRGSRNEPARVALTAGCVARARDMSFDEFAQAATANARSLFSLSSDACL
jgi:TatD DNase family protein